MFSETLAGVLRVGAVGLTAAGLSASVYFLVQVGDAEDEASRLQAPATAQQTPDQPTPPTPPSPPTPPAPPAPPSPDTPATLDTSDWKTYSSPLGFTIKYPPDWVVKEEDPPVLTPLEAAWVEAGIILAPRSGVAIIMNQGLVDAWAQAESGEARFGGEAWIEISGTTLPSGTSGPPPPEFDTDALLLGCQPEGSIVAARGGTREGREATLAGQPAVRCLTTGPDRTEKYTIRVEAYDVASPHGGTLTIVASTVDGQGTTLQLTNLMLATISFEDLP